MIHTFTLLLLFQLAGEMLVRLFGLPIPGPVIGMVLLFVTLLCRDHVGHELRANAAAFLQHMSLLFVPAGVGVMVHVSRVAKEWLPITASLVLSTFAGMAVTAWVILALLPRRTEEKSGDKP